MTNNASYNIIQMNIAHNNVNLIKYASRRKKYYSNIDNVLHLMKNHVKFKNILLYNVIAMQD